MVAQVGFEPTSQPYEGYKETAPLPRNIQSLFKSCSGLRIANWRILALENFYYFHNYQSPYTSIFSAVPHGHPGPRFGLLCLYFIIVSCQTTKLPHINAYYARCRR